MLALIVGVRAGVTVAVRTSDAQALIFIGMVRQRFGRCGSRSTFCGELGRRLRQSLDWNTLQVGCVGLLVKRDELPNINSAAISEQCWRCH
jgi:hypothetical protein